MDLSQSNPSRCCPQCGAELCTGLSKCWLCRVESPSRDANESVAKMAGLRQARSVTSTDHGLSSLVLFVTLFAVLGGIFIMEPGLGILAAILAVPALIRTIVVAFRRTEDGDPLSAGCKVAIFLLTIVMVVVLIVAAVAAFLFTCLVTAGIDDSLIGIGIVFGGTASLAVVVILVGLFWKISRSNRNG